MIRWVLTRPVSFYDIQDGEAFVRSQLPRVLMTADRKEELIQEGLRILTEMANRYQPGKNGLDPTESRFSGYASKYLQGKLRDQWHRMEGHSLITLADGKRKWNTGAKVSSLDAMTVDSPDGIDHLPSMQTTDEYDTDMESKLRRALDMQWELERERAVQVGVCLGLAYSPGETAKRLGIRPVDVTAAVDLIKRSMPFLTTLEAA